MGPDSRALFLSLRPEYAELLLEGRKTVELRRIRPQAPIGTLVLLYASTPRRALLGTCEVASIREASPTAIWNLHGSKTGIGREAFRCYFRGAARAVAITVSNPQRLDHPIPLTQLRGEWINFQPPQSFRYVGLDGISNLLECRATEVDQVPAVRLAR